MIPMALLSDYPGLARGIDAFNRGEYFDAAETFEQSLGAVDADFKELVGALNRIAAAMHLRFERGARQGSINLLSQALMSLEDLKPERGGIDIERLFAEVDAFTAEVRAAPRQERDGLKYRARIFVERRRAPTIRRRK
jgi:predicted metal-dependent hydrolase